MSSYSVLNADGTQTQSKIWNGMYFKVDRRSGVTLGGQLANNTYATIEVLDPGGPAQSWKALAKSGPVSGTTGGHHAIYLVINEFEAGSNKPFIGLDDSSMFTGTCQ